MRYLTNRIELSAVIACFLLAIGALTAPPNASAAQPSQAGATVSETAKKRAARVKRLLQRSIDELDQSLFYVQEDISEIRRQIGALSFGGQTRAEDELRSFLDWHAAYADQLGSFQGEFERDLNAYYTGLFEGKDWVKRYKKMGEAYLRLNDQLAAKEKRFEDEKNRTEDRVQLMKFQVIRLQELMREDEFPGREEKSLRKKRDPREDAMLIGQLQAEIAALERLIPQFTILIEKSRGGMDWLSMKAREIDVLSEVAGAIGSEDPAALESSYRRIIRAYESDIDQLTRKADEFDRKRSSLTRSGTMSMLERQEELARFFEQGKSRCQRHINWLKAHVGNYRAEMVELWSEGGSKSPP